MRERKRIYTSLRNQRNTTTISLTLNVNRETNHIKKTDEKKKHR